MRGVIGTAGLISDDAVRLRTRRIAAFGVTPCEVQTSLNHHCYTSPRGLGARSIQSLMSASCRLISAMRASRSRVVIAVLRHSVDTPCSELQRCNFLHSTTFAPATGAQFQKPITQGLFVHVAELEVAQSSNPTASSSRAGSAGSDWERSTVPSRRPLMNFSMAFEALRICSWASGRFI